MEYHSTISYPKLTEYPLPRFHFDSLFRVCPNHDLHLHPINFSDQSITTTMASATFRLNQLTPLSPKPQFTLLHFKSYTFSPLHNRHAQITTKCLDISKEDKPTDSLETQDEFDKRRLEEKFAVLNTGIYECRSCGYLYNEAAGDPSYPVAPGLPFDKLPEGWRCATCGAAKSFFASKSVEIAGFAQNQQFGLGGNTLTSGQKAILIYGSLLFFFVLFLSGYFLQ